MASQWLNIKGKKYFIETSVVLISVMLAFNHKKIKEIKKIKSLFCLYNVHLKIECEIIAI